MRFLFVAMIVTAGALFSGANAFAASALTDTTNASVAQYATTEVPSGNLGASGPGSNDGSSPTGGSGTASTPGAAATQAPRQLSSSDTGKLPFTGYVVIPVLLVGMALLLSGLAIRRVRPQQLQV